MRGSAPGLPSVTGSRAPRMGLKHTDSTAGAFSGSSSLGAFSGGKRLCVYNIFLLEIPSVNVHLRSADGLARMCSTFGMLL